MFLNRDSEQLCRREIGPKERCRQLFTGKPFTAANIREVVEFVSIQTIPILVASFGDSNKILLLLNLEEVHKLLQYLLMLLGFVDVTNGVLADVFNEMLRFVLCPNVNQSSRV